MPENVLTPPFNARVVERLSVGPASRRERIVHSLDGLETPVRPQALTAAGDRLWQRLRAKVPDVEQSADFLLGLDAGGILPTVSLAAASALPYKIAWKLHLPLAGEVRFTEPHATRTDVFAYGIAAGQRIVLVDDEITTGHTLTNLALRLREAGAEPLGAACLVEDAARGGRTMLADHGIPLVTLTRIGAAT
ncbi:phosphoribosyltransferase [Streptomyces sp. YIM 98790]|uniref:phosphoribosyltransferase n=1 Tax=Streptomyces sp. YIM 98790 TaxID=2689077 RepID=UPI00140B02F6|nr:phosphoribosyltransferase domain-containing protein [Streptomyces sp. YIM 98790]